MFPHRSSQAETTSSLVNQASASLSKALNEIDEALAALADAAEKLPDVIDPEEERRLNEKVAAANTDVSTSMRGVRDVVAGLQETLRAQQPTNARKEYARTLENVVRGAKSSLAQRIDRYNTISLQLNEYARRDIAEVVHALNPDLDAKKLENFVAGLDAEPNAEELAGRSDLTTAEKEQLQQVQEKKAGLLRFEKTVGELLALLADMNALVDESSELLDSVEFNMAEAAAHAEGGLVDVKKAVDANLAAKRCKYLFCGTLAAFAAVVAAYIIKKLVVG